MWVFAPGGGRGPIAANCGLLSSIWAPIRGSVPNRGTAPGDEADLYLAFNPRLVRIVQRSVDAPRGRRRRVRVRVVQFMRVQPDRERNWRSWLITTAEREAWRLRRPEAKTLSFEFETADEFERDPVDPRHHIHERARLRHALELLSAVPERGRQIKALHVIGDGLTWSYARGGNSLARGIPGR